MGVTTKKVFTDQTVRSYIVRAIIAFETEAPLVVAEDEQGIDWRQGDLVGVRHHPDRTKRQIYVLGTKGSYEASPTQFPLLKANLGYEQVPFSKVRVLEGTEVDFMYDLITIGRLSTADNLAEMSWVRNGASQAVTPEEQVLNTTPVYTAKTYTATNLATTFSNNVLTASVNGALIIDGLTLLVDDIVLVANQTNPIHNGLYIVTATGSAETPFVLTRVDYYNEASEISPSIIQISSGTFANTFYQQVTPNVVLNTSPIVYETTTAEEVAAAISYISGRTIFVDGASPNSTDTRIGLSVYDRDNPFKTVISAKAVATAGDTIYVLAGNYPTGGVNLAKSGVNWYLSPNVKLSAAFSGETPTGALPVFHDNDGFKQFSIFGQGEIYSNGSPFNDTDAFNIRQNSVVYLEGRILDSIQVWKNSGKVSVKNFTIRKTAVQTSVSGVGGSRLEYKNCNFRNAGVQTSSANSAINCSVSFKDCDFIRTDATVTSPLLLIGKTGGGAQNEGVSVIEGCRFINLTGNVNALQYANTGCPNGTRILKDNMFYTIVTADNKATIENIGTTDVTTLFYASGNIGNTDYTGTMINSLAGSVIDFNSNFKLVDFNI